MRVSLVLVSALALGCQKPASPDATSEVGPRGDRFVIAHTNDLHAHFRPQAVPWSDQPVGGALVLSATVEAIRTEWGEDRVLLLDGGDVRSGTPLDEYVVHGVHTGAMLDWLEAAGYDAWAIGNHEFDRGLEDAGAFVAASPVPVLAANLLNAEGGPIFPELRRSLVLRAGDLDVGVIGAVTPGLTRFVAGDMSAMVVADANEAVRAEVEALEDEVDVLVALTHLGIEDDRLLARSVPELDLIVGGHSHTRLLEPEQVGDTWIVQAGSYMQGLGVSVVDPVGDGTIELDYALHNPAPDALPAEPDPEVAAFYERWRATLEKDWGIVVGHSEVELWRSYDAESPLGTWIGDVLRDRTGADVGLYNAGGLRADLPSGPVEREDLYTIFPFGNEVVVAEVQGAALLALALRNATASLHPDTTSHMQQSGVDYTFRERMGSAEIVDITVAGEPLDLDRTYTVATNSFVLGQWARYLGSAPPETVRGTGVIVRDMAQAWFETHERLEAVPTPGGRRLD